MLSLSTGHGVDYLINQVGAGRESYYLDAVTEGEPPGRWYGSGAAALGLAGEVDPTDMTRLYEGYADPRDARFRTDEWEQADRLGRKPGAYATPEERLATLMEREPDALPERVAELRRQAERGARQSVAYIDATFSVQKSVTALHTAYARMEAEARKAGDEEAEAAWRAHKEAVEEAIWAGNRAALDYLSEHAGYSRVGHHGGGAGRWVDAHDWTVASFFQHTSRDLDPQLHIHNAILNRVVCPDGQVRTLDSRAIHNWRGSAAAVGERAMEEHLTMTLGVTFATRADGKAREVVGVDQAVMDLFSNRRRAITEKTRKLVEQFTEQFGREPNALELSRLSRQATMATRRAKSHEGETLEQRLARWDAELRAEVAEGLASVAEKVRGHATGTAEAQEWSPSAVIATALAEVQAGQAAWTRSDLARAINAALPDSLGGLDGAEVARLLDTLVDHALTLAETERVTADVRAEVPDELRRADGASAYEAPSGARYATVGHLRAEAALRDSAVVRGRRAVTPAEARAWLDAARADGITLGVDQAAAIEGMLTSGAATEVLIGPAGTGKSYTVGNLASAWTDLTGGRVFGLATSQAATEVLAEDGVTARNIARWLATQGRIEEGREQPGDADWRLTAHDIVVLDEAAMVDTAAHAAVRAHVEAAGAKLVLAGDPRQLAAVGAGGTMEMLAHQAVTYELAEVRRFAAPWEGEASLRLRAGDVAAIEEYDARGRIVDAGTTETAGLLAAGAWLGDHLAGKRSIVVVDSNEQAAALSAHIRAELVALGHVQEHGVTLGRQGTTAGVGDLIQLRHTDRRLGVANRARYRVEEIRPDGSIVATGEAGTVLLPRSYVARHVDLGYAATVHAVQGLTVDTAHGVVGRATSWHALYVALTRGRERSTAYVTTHEEVPDAPTGETHERQRRTAGQVLRDLATAEQETAAAVVQAARESERVASAATLVDRYADGAQLATQARLSMAFDMLAATGRISEEERQALAADPAAEPLARLLRSAELAGHDPVGVLTRAVEARTLDGARSLAQVLHHRVQQIVGDAPQPQAESLADVQPAGLTPEWAGYMGQLGELLDDRGRVLGARIAEEAPQWAVESLGPVPDDPADRLEWEHRAGVVGVAREATEHEDQGVALGVAPRPGRTEHRAVWHAAWRALGRPEATREEAELSDGALRVRARAWEREQQWAPQWVADELRASAQAVARHRQEAARLAAEAEAALAPEDAETLRARAQERAALADVLAEREAQLTLAHEARGEWYAETAMTRAAAERARAELVRRGVDIAAEEDRTTAREWLAAEEAARREDDEHRDVTEADLMEPEADGDHGAAERVDEHQADAAESVDAQAEDEAPMPRGVPTMAETATAVLLAQQALAELADRRSAEAAHQEEADERSRVQAWREADERAAAAEAAQDYASA